MNEQVDKKEKAKITAMRAANITFSVLAKIGMIVWTVLKAIVKGIGYVLYYIVWRGIFSFFGF